MDGSCNAGQSVVAHCLARIKQSKDGLTAASFEQLVRAVWEEVKLSQEVDVINVAIQNTLTSLGGLVWSVKKSAVMFGAIDVECTFYYLGKTQTHTVHLW